MLIPPLTSLHDKYIFFKKEKLSILLEKDDSLDINKNTNNEISNPFDDIIKTFLSSIQIINVNKCSKAIKYNLFLDDMFPYYISYFNNLENVFYSEGTTFHKQQHIDNIKNLILSLRLISYEAKIFNKREIIDYIKDNNIFIFY